MATIKLRYEEFGPENCKGNVIKSVTRITESGVGIKPNRLIGNMRSCGTGWQGLLCLSGGF